MQTFAAPLQICYVDFMNGKINIWWIFMVMSSLIYHTKYSKNPEARGQDTIKNQSSDQHLIIHLLVIVKNFFVSKAWLGRVMQDFMDECQLSFWPSTPNLIKNAFLWTHFQMKAFCIGIQHSKEESNVILYIYWIYMLYYMPKAIFAAHTEIPVY